MRRENGPNGPHSKLAILAVGKEAKTMLGRTPGNIKAIRPLKDGVIADFQSHEANDQIFYKRVPWKIFLLSPNVICVPYGATQVEKRAIRESAERAGAKTSIFN